MKGAGAPHRALGRALVAMSGLAVLSDAILVACYPQFFARRFGVTSALHVGAYLAAISVVVMCCLPAWAHVARRIETLRLLPATQCAAGVLCLLAAAAEDVASYWTLSLAMFACKSSYLLMYPRLMRLHEGEARSHTIGVLSVLVNLGGIAGAVAGGWLLRRVGPQACLVLMAAGDFAQMAVGLWLVKSGRAGPADAAPTPAPTTTPTPAPARLTPPGPPPHASSRTLRELCAAILLVDFSAFVASPFFCVHWERLTSAAAPGLASAVYAIPGAAALAALLVNRRRGAPRDREGLHLWLGAAGLLLQALPQPAVVLAARAMFGWAIFQLVVQLEVRLFSEGTAQTYARDFSRFNMAQQLGALLSCLAAGALVQRLGTEATFCVGAAGLLLTASLHRLRQSRGGAAVPALPLGDAHAG